MVKFYKISGLEKLTPFEKGVTDLANGFFGTVADGAFTAGENATHFVYDVEKGDAFMCNHVGAYEKRLCSLEKVVGHELIIAPEHIALDEGDELEVGTVLKSDTDGLLAVAESGSGLYLKVTQLTNFDGDGAVVAVVKKA